MKFREHNQNNKVQALGTERTANAVAEDVMAAPVEVIPLQAPARKRKPEIKIQ